jgi:hypothetical protein
MIDAANKPRSRRELSEKSLAEEKRRKGNDKEL